jgi:hypothetical protein
MYNAPLSLGSVKGFSPDPLAPDDPVGGQPGRMHLERRADAAGSQGR